MRRYFAVLVLFLSLAVFSQKVSAAYCTGEVTKTNNWQCVQTGDQNACCQSGDNWSCVGQTRDMSIDCSSLNYANCLTIAPLTPTDQCGISYGNGPKSTPITCTRCRWVAGDPVDPPVDPPSCPTGFVGPAPDVNCDQIGLLGEYTVNGKSGFRYDCGPTANVDSPLFMNHCGYWTANWDGYFVAPVEGDYQFLSKVFPSGQFMIDLNDDGAMSCPPRIADRQIWGDRMFGLDMSSSSGCEGIEKRPKWVDLSEDNIGNSGCGWNGCSCGPAGDRCAEGEHCEEVDAGTIPSNSTPPGQSKWWTEVPWEQTYPGLSAAEMPTSFPRIPPYLTRDVNKSGGPGISDECIYASPKGLIYYAESTNKVKGYAYIWAKRHLTAGKHRVSFSWSPICGWDGLVLCSGVAFGKHLGG